jgi:hypothetical protein
VEELALLNIGVLISVFNKALENSFGLGRGVDGGL